MDNSLLLLSELQLIQPLLILGLGALVLMLLDVFLPRKWPRGCVTGLILIAALYQSDAFAAGTVGETIFQGALYSDAFSSFLTMLFLAATFICVLLTEARLAHQGIEAQGEFYALLLMTTAGAVVFVSAAELITLFVGLEIMSLALYCLCGSATRSGPSVESAVKYFLLGSFSSAFFLFGIALLYGLSGSTQIPVIAAELRGLESALLPFALGLVLVGVAFKVGLVPFHFWVPDVYQGAPTSVTAYMSCVIKAAAVGVGLRLMWVLFGSVLSVWSGTIWLLAVLTMVAGNLIAVRQRNMKRMLAYSSIAHAGYILVAFLAPGEVARGGAAILFYLVIYLLMTMGAFGVVLAVSAADPEQKDADDITRFNGLGRRSPFLAACMTLCLFSLAGLPPAMGGLLGKFFLFSAAVKAGYVGLAVIGVLCAVVSCYYYLRVVVAMYFLTTDTEEETPYCSMWLAAALVLCVLGVLLFGTFPSLLYTTAAGVVSGLS